MGGGRNTGGGVVQVADIPGIRKSVRVLPSTSSLGDLARVMRLENIGSVVLSSGAEPIAGIVTERDIVHAVAGGGPAAVNLTAAEVMTSPVPTCSLQDRVTSVMQTMLDERIRHLPLVDDHRLIGMVSMGDVVKGVVERMQLEANVLRDLYLTARSR
jgi:signal-transduction protein with cAMP-binding, CBS, and nucleotidyltransferase domain